MIKILRQSKKNATFFALRQKNAELFSNQDPPGTPFRSPWHPPEDKEYVVYETAYFPFPRGSMLTEIFAWFDKYQGLLNAV
jgi:hypothetical protein